MYVGQGAMDRGVYLYPDINFCANPEAICNHPRTNELRWLIGMLEWSDRVQSYSNADTGWNYIDELINFVNTGMNNDSFINGAINILTRKCHDDSCWDSWQLNEDYDLRAAARRNNFRKILLEVFNLPMTYQPTVSPIRSPTYSPTLSPTLTPMPMTSRPTSMPVQVQITEKPTRRKKDKVQALPPNTAQLPRRLASYRWICFAIISGLFLWT